MARLIRWSLAAALVILVVPWCRVCAEGPGQEDLDRATEVKLDAKTVDDLAEVIRLVESALTKGLDQEQAQFARNLLAAAVIQRGSHFAAMVIASSPRSRRRRQTGKRSPPADDRTLGRPAPAAGAGPVAAGDDRTGPGEKNGRSG
jgi:hypothetical protein